MDGEYELFCVADPLFCDTPTARVGESAFALGTAELPPGWERLTRDLWVRLLPLGATVPLQGWKIHVSACRENAEGVLATVWDYCRDRRIAFKFLESRLALHMRNAKYAPRESSGKFITIYPADDAACERICAELGDRLAGQPGPTILTDLRIGESPLHVRYGAFAERWCEDEAGERIPALEDPTGALVPDRRAPVFSVPSWVTMPGFLGSHLARRNAVTMEDLPYRVEQAVHFSNGGGVYLARETTSGQQVILKEARPHAGLDAIGADAVARLTRERDILLHLAGLDVVPAVRDSFELGGHHFLVEDLIEGRALNSFFAEIHPLVDPEPDPERIADYTAWALEVCAGVEAAIAALHERGVVFNDLHTYNIIVRPDDTVTLIDFESAALVEEERTPGIGAPGFQPRGRSGFAVDRYSLACLRLAMFVPLTDLIPLDPGKAEQIAETVAELFGVDRGFLAEAVQEITGSGPGMPASPRAEPGQEAAAAPGAGSREIASIASGSAPGSAPRRPSGPGSRPGREADGPRWPELRPDEAGWELARDAMTRAILASATPGRSDRLFPGDILQFAPGGGLNVAHGAAGVLHALAATGAGRVPELEAWLLDRAGQPAEGMPPGLYDGLLGIACVLDDLGHRDAALELAETCLEQRWEHLVSDLSGGLAGIALGFARLAVATGETALRDAALRAAGIVASRVEAGAFDPAGGAAAEAKRVGGLMQGASGIALMFVRFYELTGDAGYLDHAAALLRVDLGRCVFDRNGSLQVDEGWRMLPYLAKGSAGVGCALDDYLLHRDDQRFLEAAEAAARAARAPYYALSGLYVGRAGLVAYLARKHEPGTAMGDPHVAAHIRRLAWHAVPYRDGLAFPGDRLSRLSMDLATGTAGVLLALGAACCTHPVHLPFLGPLTGFPRTTSSARTGATEGGEFIWLFSTSRV